MPISQEDRQRRSDHMKSLHAKKKEAKMEATETMQILAAEGLEAPKEAVKKAPKVRRNLFNGTQQRLAVHGSIEGYHLHIFNDSPGRIEQALASGYEFVAPNEVELEIGRRVVDTNTAIDEKVRYITGINEQNNPLYAFLMKIPLEFFESDQKDVQDKINQAEDYMVRNAGIGADKIGNTYIPGGRKSALTITRN